MNVDVYYGGQKGGSMPYAALPAFRLFCKQSGFQINWDAKSKRIDLDSGLKGMSCVLVLGGTSGDRALEREVLVKVQKFLADSEAQVIVLDSDDALPNGSHVAIRFSAKEFRNVEKPRIVLFQREEEKRKLLIDSLQTELKHTGVICQTRLSKLARSAQTALSMQLQLPYRMESTKRKALAEKIAFYLASGILSYFLLDLHISPLSYLPPGVLKSFLHGVLNTQSVEVEAADRIEEGAGTEPTEGADVSEEETKDEGPVANTVPELEEETGEVAEADVSEVVEQTDNEVSIDDTPEGFPVVNRMTAAAQVESRMEAEVFFDYTLMHSDTEDRPYLLIGSLTVKNTGTEHLYNPIVCLRVNPIEGIKLGGQVLPPKFVDTLGVQTSAGIKGWKYLQDDWFEQAQERGEYWIAPIHPMSIPPKMSESFSNFQISIMKPEKRTSVTVEGMILFNDQQVHFMANNRIAVSF